MNEPKTYVPKCSCKAVTFASGKSILKVGFHVETLIAFIKQHANERGYVNFGISERKETSQHGETHSVWLDTWRPGQTAPKATPEAAKRGVEHMRSAVNTPPPEEDVPF